MRHVTSTPTKYGGGARVAPTRSGWARPDRVELFQTYLTGHALRIGTIRAPKCPANPGARIFKGTADDSSSP